MSQVKPGTKEPSTPAVLGKPEADGSRFDFDAIGTRWQIETAEPLSRDLRSRILHRIERFDTTYSRFRPDSLVTRIAAAPDGGRFEFPEDSLALFALYDRLHAATDGAVDPLVGRELELLGYDSTYSLTPAPDEVRAAERARGRVTWAGDISRDGRTVVTERPLVIDVGAVGKGYLVDLLSAILREAGHTDFVVDGSGDLRHVGERAIRVGLEHPFDPRRVIGVAHLRAQALCASGTSRRAWGDGLHHVLDARTGIPVSEVVATWVMADETALADGLATALFFTEARRLAEFFEFTYVRMRSDRQAEFSPDFMGELFT
ncbi:MULTISPECIES: FAD:protein FMN transferase [Streptomyces]|uniref:FAD:protein FMN transferase n=2 Tax=Streptomyces TaxID=1883 RepID=A0ABV9IL92_9ACTN